MFKQMTKNLFASGYNWDANLSDKKIDSVLHSLKVGDSKKRSQKYLKKIAFALLIADDKLLEKLCVAQMLNFKFLLNNMGACLMNDVVSGYVPIETLSTYIENSRLFGSAEFKLIKQSVTNDKLYNVLKLYIEKHRLTSSGELELIEQSATNDRMYNVLNTYIKKSNLYDSAELQLIKQSATNDKMYNVLKLYIEKFPLYSPLYISGELELIKQSATNDKMYNFLKLYIEKYPLYKPAVIELVGLAYGNRKITAILDFYKSKYPDRVAFIQSRIEAYRQEKQNIVKQRRDTIKQQKLFVEIANSLKNRNK